MKGIFHRRTSKFLKRVIRHIFPTSEWPKLSQPLRLARGMRHHQFGLGAIEPSSFRVQYQQQRASAALAITVNGVRYSVIIDIDFGNTRTAYVIGLTIVLVIPPCQGVLNRPGFRGGSNS